MVKVFEQKLFVPNFSSYFARKRLHSFLDKHRHAALISITSDAGYGKTALVSGYLQESKTEAIWYRLDETDQTPAIFLSYLKTAISRIIPNGHIHSPIEIQPGEIENEVQYLLSILSNWQKPLMIVLDNYHKIDNQDIQEILNQLLQYSSTCISYILIGQSKPKAIPVHIKLLRNYVEISREQLSFTKQETEEFLRYICRQSIENHQMTAIHEKTQGWVTGIQLLLHSIRDWKETERSDFLSHFTSKSDIQKYFMSEVMDSLSGEMRMFLLKTSLLSELDAAVINKYLTISNAEELIGALMRSNSFITKDEHGIVRYHPMFRSFLYAEFLQNLSLSEKEIEHYHLLLAEIYQEACQFFSSFVHFVTGKDYYRATQLIRSMEKRYNPEKFFILINNWLDSLNTQDSIPFDSVFLFRCIPLYILDQLILPIEERINELKDKGNALHLSYLQYFLATIYRHKGNFAKSKNLFHTSLNHCLEMNIYGLTVLNYLGLSEILLCSGEMKESERHAKSGIYYAEKHQISHCQIYALWMLAEIHLHKNEAAQAKPFLDQMRQLLELSKEDDARSVYLHYSLSRLFCLNKDYLQAVKFAELGVSQAERFGNDLDTGGSYMQLGQSYLHIQEWEKADNCFAKAASFLEYFSYYRCLTLSFQVKLFEVQRKNEYAKEKRNKLIKICQEKEFKSIIDSMNDHFISTIEVNEKGSHPNLSIEVLGDFKITYEGNPIYIKRKSSLQLLQLFIANREKKLQKDFLLDSIFRDTAIDTIHNHFYVALSTLRKALEPQLKTGRKSRYISQSENHYLFNCEHLYLDVNEFQSLLCLDINSPPKENQLINLLKAEKLYKGHFFEEYPYEHFLESEREKLRSDYINLLKTLAHYYWDSDENEKGIEYFEKILNLDPYQEQIYIDFIKKLLESNFLLQAKKVASRNIKFVENELGIDVRSKLNSIFSPYNFSV
ncbi:LuxR family maltose regulon positive regulatory protein [Cytobacillus firmus]|uniref:LuxR family maltose regulon positive regulatory protein n=2 Tax=Cytobacillus TaxID=2675230 RepID=A0A366K3D5_CYTFI|nr:MULTISPECIES: BTAD domain-containing putative transcriptional regulator [Cytobacillus]RBP95842.1 LuxR family maltose regulon positive regulatory protein [Cytobacillus firmus]TDX44755.1 LuxR family maltose regulon positive regulatory protein [Cytobacillus oceanisediminis]